MARVFARFPQHFLLHVFGVSNHAAELQHLKQMAVLAHADLPKNNRTFSFKRQRQHDQQTDRRPKRQAKNHQNDVQRALQQLIGAAERAMRANAQKRDAVKILHLHLADVQLHDLGNNTQISAAFTADLGQLLNQIIMLPAESDNHRVDHMLSDDLCQLPGAAQSLDAPHAGRGGVKVIVQEADW